MNRSTRETLRQVGESLMRAGKLLVGLCDEATPRAPVRVVPPPPHEPAPTELERAQARAILRKVERRR